MENRLKKTKKELFPDGAPDAYIQNDYGSNVNYVPILPELITSSEKISNVKKELEKATKLHRNKYCYIENMENPYDENGCYYDIYICDQDQKLHILHCAFRKDGSIEIEGQDFKGRPLKGVKFKKMNEIEASKQVEPVKQLEKFLADYQRIESATAPILSGMPGFSISNAIEAVATPPRKTKKKKPDSTKDVNKTPATSSPTTIAMAALGAAQQLAGGDDSSKKLYATIGTGTYEEIERLLTEKELGYYFSALYYYNPEALLDQALKRQPFDMKIYELIRNNIQASPAKLDEGILASKDALAQKQVEAATAGLTQTQTPVGKPQTPATKAKPVVEESLAEAIEGAKNFLKSYPNIKAHPGMGKAPLENPPKGLIDHLEGRQLRSNEKIFLESQPQSKGEYSLKITAQTETLSHYARGVGGAEPSTGEPALEDWGSLREQDIRAMATAYNAYLSVLKREAEAKPDEYSAPAEALRLSEALLTSDEKSIIECLARATALGRAEETLKQAVGLIEAEWLQKKANPNEKIEGNKDIYTEKLGVTGKFHDFVTRNEAEKYLKAHPKERFVLRKSDTMIKTLGESYDPSYFIISHIDDKGECHHAACRLDKNDPDCIILLDPDTFEPSSTQELGVSLTLEGLLAELSGVKPKPPKVKPITLGRYEESVRRQWEATLVIDEITKHAKGLKEVKLEHRGITLPSLFKLCSTLASNPLITTCDLHTHYGRIPQSDVENRRNDLENNLLELIKAIAQRNQNINFKDENGRPINEIIEKLVAKINKSIEFLRKKLEGHITEQTKYLDEFSPYKDERGRIITNREYLKRTLGLSSYMFYLDNLQQELLWINDLKGKLWALPEASLSPAQHLTQLLSQGCYWDVDSETALALIKNEKSPRFVFTKSKTHPDDNTAFSICLSNGRSFEARLNTQDGSVSFKSHAGEETCADIAALAMALSATPLDKNAKPDKDHADSLINSEFFIRDHNVSQAKDALIRDFEQQKAPKQNKIILIFDKSDNAGIALTARYVPFTIVYSNLDKTSNKLIRKKYNAILNLSTGEVLLRTKLGNKERLSPYRSIDSAIRSINTMINGAKASAKPIQETLDKALWIAIQQSPESIEAVKQSLKNGANPLSENPAGIKSNEGYETALSHAIKTGSFETAQLLLGENAQLPEGGLLRVTRPTPPERPDLLTISGELYQVALGKLFPDNTPKAKAFLAFIEKHPKLQVAALTPQAKGKLMAAMLDSLYQVHIQGYKYSKLPVTEKLQSLKRFQKALSNLYINQFNEISRSNATEVPKFFDGLKLYMDELEKVIDDQRRIAKKEAATLELCRLVGTKEATADAVKALLDEGANPNYTKNHDSVLEKPPLLNAVIGQSESGETAKIVELLIEYGANALGWTDTRYAGGFLDPTRDKLYTDEHYASAPEILRAAVERKPVDSRIYNLVREAVIKEKEKPIVFPQNTPQVYKDRTLAKQRDKKYLSETIRATDAAAKMHGILVEYRSGVTLSDRGQTGAITFTRDPTLEPKDQEKHNRQKLGYFAEEMRTNQHPELTTLIIISSQSGFGLKKAAEIERKKENFKQELRQFLEVQLKGTSIKTVKYQIGKETITVNREPAAKMAPAKTAVPPVLFDHPTTPAKGLKPTEEPPSGPSKTKGKKSR